MNRRLTITIIAVFGGLLVVSLLLNATRQQQYVNAVNTALPAVSPNAGLLYPAVEPSAITKLTLQKAGQSLTLTRVPGDWRGEDGKGQPVSVNLASIARVIQIVGTLRYTRVIIEPNLAAYGLIGDRAVNLQFEAGQRHKLSIGDLAQVSGFTYVQRDEDPAIYLVPTQSLEAINSLLSGAPPSPTP